MKKQNKQENSESAVKSITLKNSQIKILSAFIDIPLHSLKARSRNIIYKLINPALQEYETERMKLVQKYGSKNKDGELEFIDEEKTQFKIEDTEKFEKAFTKLRDIEIVFDILPSNKEAWKVTKQIVEETKAEFTVADTIVWEELLESLTIKK